MHPSRRAEISSQKPGPLAGAFILFFFVCIFFLFFFCKSDRLLLARLEGQENHLFWKL